MNLKEQLDFLTDLWGYEHYLAHVNADGTVDDYKSYLMQNIGDEELPVSPKDVCAMLADIPWRRITAGLHDIILMTGGDAECLDDFDLTWMKVTQAVSKALAA